jgi:hypothetical protein
MADPTPPLPPSAVVVDPAYPDLDLKRLKVILDNTKSVQIRVHEGWALLGGVLALYPGSPKAVMGAAPLPEIVQLSPTELQAMSHGLCQGGALDFITAARLVITLVGILQSLIKKGS